MRAGVRTAVFAVVVAAALGLPAAALANDFQQVYNDYKKHGSITACRFSESQLRNAERETPPDVEQYAPSFLDAVTSAREQAGGCKPKSAAPAPATTPAPPPPSPTSSTPTPAATPPAPPPQPAPQPAATSTATTPAPALPAHAANAPAIDARRTAHDTSGPAALWILAGLAAVTFVAALAAIASWWFGWSPDRWSRPLGASFGDFGSRFGDSSREFGDWLRLGH